jgi:Subtilase family
VRYTTTMTAALVALCLGPTSQLSAADIQSTPQMPPGILSKIPSSKLVNLDSPGRVAGEYVFVFNEASASAQSVSSIKYKVDSNVSASSPDNTMELTRAFMRSFGPAAKLRRVFKSVGGLAGFAVRGISDSDAARLAQDSRVRFVEPVITTHTQLVMSAQSTGVPNCSGTRCAPWDLDRMDQVKGTDGTYHYAATGTGVTMWIVDTGIEAHSDFGNRLDPLVTIVDSSSCTLDSNGNVTSGCDLSWIGVEDGLADPSGHGTLVASLAAGTIYGVAKGASLEAVQVVDANGSGTTPTIAAGINYVISHRHSGPNVINMSINSNGLSAVLDAAVERAISAGIIFVASAGNTNQNSCSISPNDASQIISVGATSYTAATTTDSLWTDPPYASNYGPCVTVYAPGGGVWGADIGKLYTALQEQSTGCNTPRGSQTGACVFSGTSVSAPLVAGVVALYLQNVPSASQLEVLRVILSSSVPGVIQNLPTTSPNITANLLASVWVPGNTVTQDSPGRGVPPFGGGVGPSNAANEAIFDVLLLHF